VEKTLSRRKPGSADTKIYYCRSVAHAGVGQGGDAERMSVKACRRLVEKGHFRANGSVIKPLLYL
jgi:hypothetical protein